jgi:hypothetical protein
MVPPHLDPTHLDRPHALASIYWLGLPVLTEATTFHYVVPNYIYSLDIRSLGLPKSDQKP